MLVLSTTVYTQNSEPKESPQAVELAPEMSGQLTVEQISVEPVDLFARDSYRIDTIICPFKSDIDYKPGEIECGLLQVPENREDPNSRFIELHFI